MGGHPSGNGTQRDPEHCRACKGHGHQGADIDADTETESEQLHMGGIEGNQQGSEVHRWRVADDDAGGDSMSKKAKQEYFTGIVIGLVICILIVIGMLI